MNSICPNKSFFYESHILIYNVELGFWCYLNSSADWSASSLWTQFAHLLWCVVQERERAAFLLLAGRWRREGSEYREMPKNQSAKAMHHLSRTSKSLVIDESSAFQVLIRWACTYWSVSLWFCFDRRRGNRMKSWLRMESLCTKKMVCWWKPSRDQSGSLFLAQQELCTSGRRRREFSSIRVS